MTFKELASRTHNGELTLTEATFMVCTWFVLAAEKIKERTGEEINPDTIADDFHSSLSNVGIMWSCGDDDDKISVPEAGEEIDRIVEEMVHDIVTRQTIKRIEAEREKGTRYFRFDNAGSFWLYTSEDYKDGYELDKGLGNTCETLDDYLDECVRDADGLVEITATEYARLLPIAD